jgi:hypothetical protein
MISSIDYVILKNNYFLNDILILIHAEKTLIIINFINKINISSILFS